MGSYCKSCKKPLTVRTINGILTVFFNCEVIKSKPETIEELSVCGDCLLNETTNLVTIESISEDVDKYIHYTICDLIRYIIVWNDRIQGR